MDVVYRWCSQMLSDKEVNRLKCQRHSSIRFLESCARGIMVHAISKMLINWHKRTMRSRFIGLQMQCYRVARANRMSYMLSNCRLSGTSQYYRTLIFHWQRCCKLHAAATSAVTNIWVRIFKSDLIFRLRSWHRQGIQVARPVGLVSNVYTGPMGAPGPAAAQ